MSEERVIFLDKILNELKSLEYVINTSKEKDVLPFSFINDAFLKTQYIARLLKDLEALQIGEMRSEIEKLTRYTIKLENERNEGVAVIEDLREQLKKKEREVEEVVGKSNEEDVKEEFVLDDIVINTESRSDDDFAKGFEFPVYTNCSASDVQKREHIQTEKKEVLMDEMKRSLSINDRFLFQRELFKNSRAEMDELFNKVYSFETYDEAEDYLRGNMQWDFDSEVVKDFMRVISNSFK